MASSKVKEPQEPTLRGLQTVRVDKAALLDKVRGNREDHRRIFEEALAGWQEQIISDLEDAVADAKAGRGVRYRFNLPKPDDHTDDYDSVIALLEMSKDSEFELTWTEFQNFAMDKWNWQAHFLASASSYGSLAAGSKMETLNYNQD